MVKVSFARILLDVFVLALVGLTILTFKYGVLPTHRGFYCDDESLRYPYKDSTVSNVVLDLVCVAFPICTMIFVEWYRVAHYEPRRFEAKLNPRIQLFNRNVHPVIVRTYFFVGYFLFGVAVNQIFTDIGKFTIGRLRPHFFDVCRPNVGYSHCSGHQYYEEYTCTYTDDPYKLKNMRMSFPSGHSSLSAYAMLFLAIYIQARVGCRVGSALMKPFIQFIIICVALAIALSRITDFKHHWSDVVAGLFLGSLVASILTMHVMKMFNLEQKFDIGLYTVPAANKDAVNIDDL